jgi:type IV secretory pathway VirB2 component (pilin)
MKRALQMTMTILILGMSFMFLVPDLALADEPLPWDKPVIKFWSWVRGPVVSIVGILGIVVCVAVWMLDSELSELKRRLVAVQK